MHSTGILYNIQDIYTINVMDIGQWTMASICHQIIVKLDKIGNLLKRETQQCQHDNIHEILYDL